MDCKFLYHSSINYIHYIGRAALLGIKQKKAILKRAKLISTDSNTRLYEKRGGITQAKRDFVAFKSTGAKDVDFPQVTVFRVIVNFIAK